MANPGYPQQPQQPPMQQMGQPMPQPGGPPTPAPMKRGTSKMVPIVVSAGLAVGTFCGLLFGVGLGEPATAAPSTGNNVKPSDPSETAPAKGTKPATTSSSTTPAKPATPATPATTTVAAGSAATTPAAGSAATKPAAGSAAPTTTAAAGSGATPAAGSGATAGSAAAKPTVAAETAVKKPKLTVELSPDTVAATAKITVDGKPIEGNSLEIDLGKETKKEVKIVVKASGYKTVEQKVDVDSDVNVKIELIKRSSVPTTPGTGPRPGGTTPPGGKKKPGGGGLIDI